MQDFLTVLQIVLGIFALFGIYSYIRSAIDSFVMSKAGAKCKILICSCNEDPEYVVRFAESRFVYGEYAGFFDGIILSDKVDISESQYTKLNNEFNNISK